MNPVVMDATETMPASLVSQWLRRKESNPSLLLFIRLGFV
ncbi:Hypothetical protein EAG7_01191 [Klebsiella aerogenes]|nr:Hypothetical protein EAG7_01191 [Klebsiella aerogenes]CCG29699.1 hypothetical protein [Klebsiella aerogenes EA1509E]